MSEKRVTQSLLLPELKFIKETHTKKIRTFHCEKVSKFEVCPKCATQSSVTYDHRYINPRDSSIRNKLVILRIKKRRFKCQNKKCGCIFTEPVQRF